MVGKLKIGGGDESCHSSVSDPHGFAPAGFPCGLPLPGFGMASPGGFGELLVDITGPYTVQVGGLWFGGATTVDYAFSVPFNPSLAGVAVYAQGLMTDFTPGALIPFALANGARLVIGS